MVKTSLLASPFLTMLLLSAMLFYRLWVSTTPPGLPEKPDHLILKIAQGFLFIYSIGGRAETTHEAIP